MMILNATPGRIAAVLAIVAAGAALPACQASAPGTSNAASHAAVNAQAAPVPASASSSNAAAPRADAAATASGWSPNGYRMIGTEPFWGGTATGTEIVYTTPDNQAGERIAVTATYGPINEVFAGTREGQPFVLTLSGGPCSDGMSDNVHAFNAVLQVGGSTRRGCANRQ